MDSVSMQGVSTIFFFLRIPLERMLCVQECKNHVAKKCPTQDNWARRRAVLYHNVQE